MSVLYRSVQHMVDDDIARLQFRSLTEVRMNRLAFIRCDAAGARLDRRQQLRKEQEVELRQRPLLGSEVGLQAVQHAHLRGTELA